MLFCFRLKNSTSTSGMDVEIHTDHRPLLNIYDKPIHEAPKRLQRMLIQLQNYNLKIVCKPGSTMHIADMLSRAIVNEDPVLHPGEKELVDINMFQHLPISDEKLQEIQRESEIHFKDLKHTIINGWPSAHDKDNLPEGVKPYYNVRGELLVYDSVILKGDCVVVPPTLRHEIKRQLHSTHI